MEPNQFMILKMCVFYICFYYITGISGHFGMRSGPVGQEKLTLLIMSHPKPVITNLEKDNITQDIQRVRPVICLSYLEISNRR